MFDSDGMRWEGLFRAMQGDIGRTLLIVFLAVLASFVVSRLVKRAYREGGLAPNQVRKARIIVWSVALAVAGAAVLLLVVRMTSVIATNRIPRNDVDKSVIYEQMKKTAEPSLQPKPSR
jgi:ABC-type spermidine/putrescine transport system permease subunit I